MTNATAEPESKAAAEPRYLAWVWQKVKDMHVRIWKAVGGAEDLKIAVPETIKQPQEKQAEAMRLRAGLLREVTASDTVVMEMGGVGDIAALIAYLHGAKVLRTPAKHIKAARDQAKQGDHSQDHAVLQELFQREPDLFYEMRPRDEIVARLKLHIGWLYDIQRRIRIPTQLRLISIYRDQLLLKRAMDGKDIGVIPTEMQMAETVIGADLLEDTGITRPSDEDEAETESAESGEDGEPATEDTEKPAAKAKGKPRAKKDPKPSSLDPETLEILEELRKSFADDPHLKKAVEVEKKMEKEIDGLLKKLDVFKEVFEPIECIGPRTAGRLIAYLGTPKRFAGKSLFHSCGNFQAFCGWTVAPDGRAQRKRRDVKINFNPEVRQALYVWVSLINKRKNSPWRKWLDEFKVQIAQGWEQDGKQMPSYPQKRTAKIIGDKPEIERFVGDAALRKRVNKALSSVLGEDEAKKFKKNTAEVNASLVAFLTDEANRQTARTVWMVVFSPNEWKSHIQKQAQRKLIKHLLMYIFHTWSKLEGIDYDKKVIDMVEASLQRHVPPKQGAANE